MWKACVISLAISVYGQTMNKSCSQNNCHVNFAGCPAGLVIEDTMRLQERAFGPHWQAFKFCKEHCIITLLACASSLPVLCSHGTSTVLKH